MFLNLYSQGYFSSGDNLYAIGGFSYWSQGTITLRNINGSIRREIDYDFHLRDRYNWDKGKIIWEFGPIKFTDDYFQQFHKVGIAREYNLEGIHSGSTEISNSESEENNE